MLDMIKTRKEQLEAEGQSGFTLMEMLIVIAIIAILIAIAIPIFTSQMENARESTDAANLRSAYATGAAYVLTHQDNNGVNVGPVTITQTGDWVSDVGKDKLGGKLDINTIKATGDVYVRVFKTGTVEVGATPNNSLPIIDPLQGLTATTTP